MMMSYAHETEGVKTFWLETASQRAKNRFTFGLIGP